MDTTKILSAIDDEIARLEKARALMANTAPAPKRGRPATSKPEIEPKRRKMSAAGRARIAGAQKVRWAKVKSE